MHFISKVAAGLALASSVASAPILEERANGGSPINDGVILNYALTLEHLEAAFYAEGLAMYNAGAFNDASFPDWVRLRFTEIASHEATHVTALTAGLQAAGVKPVKACTYNFGLTGPESFLATAQVLEGVGVAAYLGAAPFIKNKDYLSIAGSILVVEAQHETWVRSAADNQDGFPKPFVAGLQFNHVYSLAAPFFDECPSDNPTLPVKAFPALTVNTPAPHTKGQKISIQVPAGAKYAAFVDAVATTFQPVSQGTAEITIPSYVGGQTYLILTSSKAATDAATVAGPAIVFIDVPATTFDY